MKSFCISLYFFLSALTLNGQCAIACNQITQLSINPNTLTEVKAEVILEGNFDHCVNFAPIVSLKDFTTGTDIETSPYIGVDQIGTEIQVTVTDLASGNTCWGKILVESINAPSNGIKRCSGEPMTNVTVKMSAEAPNIIIDESGCQYNGGNLLEYVNCVAAQNQLPAQNSYQLLITHEPSFALNGVSTLDQVLIQRHILGISKFENDVCKTLAADVTNDGKITAHDILIIRKVILNIYTSFPNAPSWKFFNKTISDSTIADPSETDLKFKQEEFPLTKLEIIGVKTGDVNNTAQ